MRGLPWWSSGCNSSFQCRGVGSIPNQATKVPHAGVCGKTSFFKLKKEEGGMPKVGEIFSRW